MTVALQAFPQETLTLPSLHVCLDKASPGTFQLLHAGPVPRLPHHLSQDPLASASPSPSPVSCSSSIYSFSRPNPSVVSEKIIANEVIWEDFAWSESIFILPDI